MRLTKTLRDAFVRAAVADVPKIEYDELIRKAATQDIVEQLPPKVRDIWKDPQLSMYVETNWSTQYGVSITYPCARGGDRFKLTPEASAKCAEWQRLGKEQDAMIRKLKDDLRGAAESVTTRKALAELLPEFEKYLPVSEQQALRSVPVIANLVADFARAGWPKDKKAA